MSQFSFAVKADTGRHEKRYFTVAEAKRALPLVKRIAADMQTTQALRLRIHGELSAGISEMSKRQQDFLDNISRKLLSYSLSRSLRLSDDPVVAQMKTRMSATGYQFGSLVETIVTSRQFLTRRRPESPRLLPAH